MAKEVHGAVIFDMDGVIVDTGPQHFAAWRSVFAEMGRELSREEFEATFGMRNPEILRRLLGERISAAQVEELGDTKEKYYRALVQGAVKAAPGFIPLLEALRNGGFKVAVGTSAPRENVELILDELGIRKELDAVVTGEDVEKGKPDPETFLLAARRCGVEPRSCVVFEDAAVGIQAGKAAGMWCVGVGKADLAQADLVVDSLEKVTASTVASLLNKEG